MWQLVINGGVWCVFHLFLVVGFWPCFSLTKANNRDETIGCLFKFCHATANTDPLGSHLHVLWDITGSMSHSRWLLGNCLLWIMNLQFVSRWYMLREDCRKVEKIQQTVISDTMKQAWLLNFHYCSMLSRCCCSLMLLKQVTKNKLNFMLSLSNVRSC